MYYDKSLVKDLGSFTINGANSLHFIPGIPVYIRRVILVFTTANTTTANIVTYGTETAAGASQTAIGTFTSPAASAVNAVQYANVGERQDGPTDADDDSIVYTGGDGEILVKPGKAFYLTSDGGGTAGVCDVYVEYVPAGLQPGDGTELPVTLS